MSQVAPAAASTPGSGLIPDSTGMFTAAHLFWIAVFAVAAIAVILWGMRLKHARKVAEREVKQHNADLRAAPPSEPPATTEPTTAGPVTAPPLSPPPLVDPDVVPLGAAPGPVAAGPADVSVTQLKGLGQKVAERLAELGITTVGQIAALTDDDAAALDARLGPFSGRMARDRWLEQARFLAAGDKAGFEAVFGRL